MRLTEWRAAAPARPSVDPKVMAVVTPVLEALGAGADPHCWVVWGDDPTTRWQLLVPTQPGLLVAYVRVSVPGEGPRASAKLVRWARVQVGELAVETQAGHRILSFSVENAIIKGVDDEADRVARFALGLVAAIDGRVADVEAVFEGPAPKRRAGRAGAATSGPKAASGGKRAPTGKGGSGAAAGAGAGKRASGASGGGEANAPGTSAAAGKAPAARAPAARAGRARPG